MAFTGNGRMSWPTPLKPHRSRAGRVHLVQSGHVKCIIRNKKKKKRDCTRAKATIYAKKSYSYVDMIVNYSFTILKTCIYILKKQAFWTGWFLHPGLAAHRWSSWLGPLLSGWNDGYGGGARPSRTDLAGGQSIAVEQIVEYWMSQIPVAFFVAVKLNCSQPFNSLFLSEWVRYQLQDVAIKELLNHF